jgi:1,2-diacylglycerol 3-alpha-glucosyltransferase
MRILMVSDVYFPRVNGVSTSIQTFARELQRQGHSVTLIAPDYGTEHNDELEVMRVPSRKVIVDPEDRMLKMDWVMERIDLLAKCEYDLIHIQTPFVAHYLGLKLARELQLPVVETYHTYFEEYLYNYISWLPRLWLRFVARRFSTSQCNSVNHVVVPSAPIEQALRRYGVKSPISIVPTGLELEKFSDGDGDRFRRVHGIAPERPLALYVGRMAHEKNIAFLLRAMQRAIRAMPELLFIMAGEGPAEHWAWRWVEREGLSDNVMFVGYLDRATQLLDCYRAADLFVFASRTETQGLVLLESMALGTPVVSTAVLGTKTVLSDGHGVLIAEEDEEDFSTKVLQLLRDEDARQALSQAALEYVREWSIGRMVERKVGVYEGLFASQFNREAVADSSAG